MSRQLWRKKGPGDGYHGVTCNGGRVHHCDVVATFMQNGTGEAWYPEFRCGKHLPDEGIMDIYTTSHEMMLRDALMDTFIANLQRDGITLDRGAVVRLHYAKLDGRLR